MKLHLDTIHPFDSQVHGPPDPAPASPARSSHRRDLSAEAQVPPFLEQAVQGCHLRAARALLDWPMLTLAASSDLSISTVKRLEDGRDQQPTRSRRKAIIALRRSGIRFVMLDDGSVAVAKLQAFDPT